MKRLFALIGLVLGLATLNVKIGSTRDCHCGAACWCKQQGLRHFRWLLPVGHKIRAGRS